MASPLPSRVRVQYVRGGHVKASRPDVFDAGCGAPLAALLRRAGGKLRIKATRAFFAADGEELLDDEACSGELVRRAATHPAGSSVRVVFTARGADYSVAPPAEGEDAAPPKRPARAPVPSVAEAMAGVERRGDGPVVRLLVTRSHLDEEAVRQLLNTAATLPGVRLAAGMPDLHAGKGCPIGAAFVTDGRVYPHLIDRDAGCGMSLVRAPSLREHQLQGKRLERMADRLRGLDEPWPGAREYLAAPLEWPAGAPVPPAAARPAFDASAGTVGRGNHFAECVVCERVLAGEEAEAGALGVRAGDVFALVHTGSRGLGGAVLDEQPPGGLDAGGEDGRRYLEAHAHALAWARRNRALVARRFLEALGAPAPEPSDCVLDIYHNAVERMSEAMGGGWVHRKGAAPGDRGAVVIPGSRGARSYVVVPGRDGDRLARAACSMAHGAGRRWARSKALAAGRARHPDPSELLVTKLSSRVVCDDRALVYEEAPAAYKSIENVVADLEERGLVRVVAVLRPLLTYKTRRA